GGCGRRADGRGRAAAGRTRRLSPPLRGYGTPPPPRAVPPRPVVPLPHAAVPPAPQPPPGARPPAAVRQPAAPPGLSSAAWYARPVPRAGVPPHLPSRVAPRRGAARPPTPGWPAPPLSAVPASPSGEPSTTGQPGTYASPSNSPECQISWGTTMSKLYRAEN